MPRLKALSKTEANDKARTNLEAVEKKLGKIPNLMATLANAPTALEAYLGFSGAMAKGTLPAKLREQIALTVGQANDCQYCVAAHSVLGRMTGLSDDEIADSRRATSNDAATDTALRFARNIVIKHGHVSDEEIASLRSAGFDDAAITEIVANVAMNLFTNYFNHVAETEVDFPAAPPLTTGPACACS